MVANKWYLEEVFLYRLLCNDRLAQEGEVELERCIHSISILMQPFNKAKVSLPTCTNTSNKICQECSKVMEVVEG